MNPSSSQPSAATDASLRTLVFGCGYLGRRVAKKAAFSGQHVWATTRGGSKSALASLPGIKPVIADWTDKRTLRDLPEVDQMLVAVSYDPHSSQSRYESQVDGLRNLLQFVSSETHVCYISTTGVYHQRNGCWVDETSPTRPRREGGRVHLWAEELLRRHRSGSPWTILRLAGIYGPNRMPRVADVIAGRPIASPPDGFLNLIHVDDAADAVLASWSRSRYGLYVVSDDEPTARGDFYREIARRCRAPSPQFIEPGDDAPDRMRSDSHKRVWNRRMKRDLITRLQYPTYREGLASIL